MTPYLLQSQTVPLEGDVAPAFFSPLWEQMPEEAIGYFATLKDTDFIRKKDLGVQDRLLRKNLQNNQSELILEGRFFWQEEHNPMLEGELRWRTFRNFRRDPQWQVVLAGNVWESFAEKGFVVEEFKASAVSDKCQALLWKEELPRSFNYPGKTADRQPVMVQRIWKKENMPFYRQWLELIFHKIDHEGE